MGLRTRPLLDLGLDPSSPVRSLEVERFRAGPRSTPRIVPVVMNFPGR